MKSASDIIRNPPFFIAGPCVIESLSTLLNQAAGLLGIFAALDLQDHFIFKASADKANRTSGSSYRGPGWRKGLDFLHEVHDLVGVPVITDVHEPYQPMEALQAVDMLQIPAMLSRQTDLIQMAGATGLPVLFKKGQTMKPMDARHMINKVAPEYPGPFAVCERGSAFGYGNVVDFSNFQVLRDLLPNSPIVFDCTHPAPSRDFAPRLAYAAMATGMVDGIFMEVHPDPAKAWCDGDKMIPTGALAPILKQLKKLWEVSR